MLNKTVKQFTSQLTASICLLAGLFLHVPFAQSEFQELDRVVAIVEDDIILASELINEVKTIKDNFRKQGRSLPDDDTLFEDILEREIILSLQLQRAQRMGIRISDQELNNALNSIAAQNNLSLANFKLAIEQQGDSYSKIREQIRQDLLIQSVQRRNVLRTIYISESEINNFLASEKGQKMSQPELNVNHILLPVSDTATTAQKTAALDAIEQLRNRAITAGNFSAIQSIISQLGAQMSPLGWRRADEMPSLFSDTLKTMKVDEISQAIQSDSGYHLIHLQASRGGTQQITTETEVRHILIKPNVIRDLAKSKAFAEEILAELKAGGDFTELARKHSDDPGSALLGGKLGWTVPGRMVPEFDAMMAATEVGKLSEPFETNFGWHILQVQDRREKDLSPERAAQLARMTLAEDKFDDALNNWLQELRDNAYVEIK